MTVPIQPLATRRTWKALEAHYRDVRELHLRKLFAEDPKRGERLTIEGVGITLDYSKNRITDETLKLLLQLAEESGLRARLPAESSHGPDRAAFLPFGAGNVVFHRESYGAYC